MVKKVITYSIIVLLLGAFGYGAISMAKNSKVAKVGDPAPDFTLEDTNGNQVSLSDYRGQFVILNFFTTWCPPCREEAPKLEAFQKKYGGEVKLLILDRGEAKATVLDFIKEFKSTSTFLLDYNNEISQPYGVTGQPETFFIDEKGKIRYHEIGPMTTDYMVEMTNKYRKALLN